MTVITPENPLGGMQYPLLVGKRWSIVTTKLNDRKEIKRLKREVDGLALRWVKSDKVSDLRIQGINDFETALSRLGLTLSLRKGGFVMSKRLSRLFSPYYYWDFPQRLKLKVDASLDKKIWDGAGLIRRGYLRTLCKHLPSAQQKVLTARLMHEGRVEFTVQTPDGQYKGHAIVVDKLDCDILVPDDPKLEVKSTFTMVAVRPVHCHQSMWLDVQSLINMYPFFDVPQLAAWLNASGREFLAAIERGDADAMFAHLNQEDSEWHVQNYLAGGGQAMWFAAIVKAIANQHIKKVKARGLGKLRIPVPGGRYYVMPAPVGEKDVQRGQALLDDAAATCWVNAEDWLSYSAIWGGADNDDALWVMPFEDYDSTRKLLLWRSPNQLGEYILCEPANELAWAQYPQLDSRKLATRIDQRTTKYLGLVQPIAHVDRPYSIGAMNDTIDQATRNIGTIGQAVNSQMVQKAMLGDIWQQQPDKLERIVDGEVKDGANLTLVKRWVKDWTRRYIRKDPYLPLVLHRRVLGQLTEPQRETVQRTLTHWLDELVAEVQMHLSAYRKQRDALAARAMPPIAVLEYGKHHLIEGAELKQAYGNYIREALEQGMLTSAHFDEARNVTERQMTQYPTRIWKQVVAAAIFRTYALGETEYTQRKASDAVVWQMGRLDAGIRRPGIAQLTLEMLRDAGVISEPVYTDSGWVKYYRNEADVGVPVQVNGVWFATKTAQLAKLGQAAPASMSAIPEPQRRKAKEAIARWEREGKFLGQEVFVREEVYKGVTRKVIYRNNTLMGFVAKDHEQRIAESGTPRLSLATDGNLLLVF